MNSPNVASWMKHIDFMVLDVAVLAISFTIAYGLKFDNLGFIDSSSWKALFAMMLLTDVALMLFLSPFSGIFRRGYWEDASASIKLALWNFIIACIVFYLFKIGEDYSREMLIVTYLVYLLLSLISKALYKKWLLHHKRSKPLDSSRRLVLITTSDKAAEAKMLAEADDIGSNVVVGFCLLDAHEPSEILGVETVGQEELVAISIQNNADQVVILNSVPTIPSETYETLIEHGIQLSFAVDEITGINAESKTLAQVGALSTLKLERYSFGSGQLLYLPLKRAFDIVLGAIGCIVLLPVMGIVKLSYIAQGDKHPILYSQTRIGQRGKTFKLYKIRTMVWNADDVLIELLKDPLRKEEWERNQKLDDDPRITPIGRFLRRTSLDEFPQFLNVFLGQMSIVGPRPLIPGELESHGGSSLYNKVKPGITGWWGCNGRSNIEYRERLELEYHYVRNCSLYLDTICIFRTFIALIKHDGAQ